MLSNDEMQKYLLNISTKKYKLEGQQFICQVTLHEEHVKDGCCCLYNHHPHISVPLLTACTNPNIHASMHMHVWIHTQFHYTYCPQKSRKLLTFSPCATAEFREATDLVEILC